MRKRPEVQLSQLVDMNNPAAVLEEVKRNFVEHYFIGDFTEVRAAFHDFSDLFDGRYPGYRACNTRFHDNIHTSDALLAISRLIDGYNLKMRKLPVGKVRCALIATIFHDAGYIQRKSDRTGTGAKYTLNHVERSIEFLREYFRDHGMSGEEAFSAVRMIRCTGLATDIEAVRFADAEERTLGFMLGTADLLGQMAARTYLERLLYLYKEFREGHVRGVTSAYDLLRNTLKFYEGTRKRFAETLGSVDRFGSVHFAKRYDIRGDLYGETIENQIRYLGEILALKPSALRRKLRRII